MEDIHNTFTRFKEEFPEVFARHEDLERKSMMKAYAVLDTLAD
jgi:hypothetical protein